MNDIYAKKRILELNKDGQDAYDKVNKEEYKQLYFAVLPHLKSCDKVLLQAVGKFFVHGALKYDRFFGYVKPAFIDDNLYDVFCDFLNALQKLDGNEYGRTCIFHIDKVWWDVLRNCSLFPYNEETEKLLVESEREINTIIIPKGDATVVNNLIKRQEHVKKLIYGIRKGIVRTLIRTTLPFNLTNTDATVYLTLDGIDISVKITNHSQGSTLPGTKIAEGSTLTTSGPSRWTTTTSEIDIDAHCLMDGLELKQSVTLQKKEDERYWISAFDFTYRIVSALWMHFHQKADSMGGWPPLPNDLQYISYRVMVGDTEFDQMTTTNPALVYYFTSLKKAPQHYDINEELPNWSVYAYQFAKVYAESGQFKESIFWLNVSVEALVEEFIRKTATTPEVLAEIEGVERKFDTAEEILAQQFPEMKGKVKWPDVEIHTSVFTKLKRAIKLSAKGSLQKEMIKKYSQVYAKRNALFHGDSIDIELEDVEKAFNAYSWLRDHL